MDGKPLELTISRSKVILTVHINELPLDERVDLLIRTGDALGLWNRLPADATRAVDEALDGIKRERGG